MLNDLSTLTNEVWSMIAEFPDYQVSNHGRVNIFTSTAENTFYTHGWIDMGILQYTFTEQHSAFIDW